MISDGRKEKRTKSQERLESKLRLKKWARTGEDGDGAGDLHLRGVLMLSFVHFVAKAADGEHSGIRLILEGPKEASPVVYTVGWNTCHSGTWQISCTLDRIVCFGLISAVLVFLCLELCSGFSHCVGRRVFDKSLHPFPSTFFVRFPE